MSIYETREGPCAAVNTWAGLTQCGSQGTLNAFSVPAGYNSIKELWLGFCEPVPADTAGAVFAVKLSGPGLKYGDQFFLVGGNGREETGNSGAAESMAPTMLKVDIAVNPGGEIWVYGAQFGTDSGTPEVACTVVWSKSGAPERYYDIRMAACAALDTDVLLTTRVDTALGNIAPPPICKHLYSVFSAWGGITLATATGGTGYIRIRNGIKQGEQVFSAGANGALSTTTGVSGGLNRATQIPCEIELTGGPMTPYGCQSGVDWGTPYLAVGVEMGP
jgi:hypothetical protein